MQPTARRRVAVQSASVLEPKLRSFRGDLTIADAAARGGLALRDAEAALFQLSSEYKGHVKATSEGELLFSFPQGMVKEQESLLTRAGRAVWKVVSGVGRFVIRAWVSVVLVGYAAILLAVLIALALKDDGDGIGDALGIVLRIVAEALFWTFHPFSPVVWEREPAWAKSRRRGAAGERKIPFYEKVNRFVFGPEAPKINQQARERGIVAEIRRLDGRVGPGDLMRVVGGTREEAEALMCRLVLDYDGEIEVSEEGAVVYRFKSLRRTADANVEHARALAPIWTDKERVQPLTGNGAGTNVLLGTINGFNLVASGVVLANGLTIERILQIVSERVGEAAAAGEVAVGAAPVADGVPLVLGAIPFAFSSALFVLPVARALRQGAKERRVQMENGRRALLARLVGREDGATPEVLPAAELRQAWRAAGGGQVTEAELTAEVRKLGGEPDVTEAGDVVYRFADLSREARALAGERKAAGGAERAVGEVVFSSLSAPDES